MFVRSRDEKHARILKQAGATVVVPETLEASLQLSAFVLEAMGLDERVVDGIVDRERDCSWPSCWARRTGDPPRPAIIGARRTW
ncbi:hypothetical protein [Massilia haematophila]|uniref:RCK N-terminal domain-containing protein n=1 Tax=Massilia haematophila TaxID=457923 RepID=A0ABV7PTB9_9BURK